MKLRHKIASLTFLLGTSLLVALSSVFYYLSRNNDIRHAFDMSRSVVYEKISDIEMLLAEEANKARSIALNPFVVRPAVGSNAAFDEITQRERDRIIGERSARWLATEDPGDPFFDAYLRNQAATYFSAYRDVDDTKFGELFITNRYGLITASSSRTTNYVQAGEDWWDRCFQTGRVYFDDRGFDLSVDDYVIGITVPVVSDSTIAGIIKYNVRTIPFIQTIFEDHHSLSDSRIIVARAGGLILYDSETPGKSYNENLPPDVTRLLTTPSGEGFYTDADGGAMLVSFTVVPLTAGQAGYGFGGVLESPDHWLGNDGEAWYVISIQLEADAITSTKRNTIHLVQVGMLFILSMAFVTIITAGSLTVPINRLVKYTRKIGQGDFEADLPVTANDEVGALATAFNQMAKSLRQTMISRDILSHEIERRKSIESALRESETRFRDLFNNMRSGVAVYEAIDNGTDFIVKDLNNAGQQISRIAKDSVIGKRITEAFPGVKEMGLFAVLDRVHRTGKPEWLPLKYYEDGRLTVWVENYVYRLPSGELIAVFEDLTGQKQAEAVIERIFNLSPDFICTAGFDGYFKKINPAFTDLLGYTEEELLTQPFITFVHPDDMENTSHALSEKLVNGVPVINFENRYLCRDGSYVWISWTSTPVQEEGLVYAIGRNVTEQKRIEEEIRELARFPEENTNPVMRIDDKGAVIYANKASGMLLDCWNTAVGGMLPDSIRQIVTQTYDRGEAGTLETVCQDRTYKMSLVPVTAAGFINIYAMDITERIQAEQALRDSEEKFRAISEQSLMAIGILQANRLIYSNKAMADLFEVPLDTPKYQDMSALAQLVHPDDRAFSVEQALKKQQGSTDDVVPDYTFRLTPPGGKLKWVEIHSKTIMYGMKSADLLTMLDVTFRKQLEEQVVQAQKMESVGRLAGGIAHDFNNMLTAIIGNAELALVDIPPDSELAEDISDIKDTAERAAHLTRQLLAFSRRQIVEPKVLNLNSLLPDIDRMLRRLIGEHIELNTVLGPDLWDIKIDPGQINQILTNLVINARDAIPETGVITIETANVVLDSGYVDGHIETEPGEFVMLAVSDTGAGMDEATISQIFEPFFTTKSKDKGTGLGLSTCYGIAKQNHGSIWAYSEPGHGTTLKVYLPRTRDDAAAHTHEQSTVTRGGTETILVVEDEPAVRKMIVRTLTEAGYRVIEAANGHEALRVTESEKSIDMLLTDVIMPLLGGRELAEKLVDRIPGIKVIFISGYTDNSIVHQGFLEEGIHFLQKPFYPAVLLRKIRQIIDDE